MKIDFKSLNTWAYFIIILLIIAMVCIQVYVGNMRAKHCNKILTITTSLYGGYNNNELSGYFFLGSGSIQETDVVYYWINDDGVKSKHSQRMDKSVFIEDGKNIMIQKIKGCDAPSSWWAPYEKVLQYEFHVPENSIVQMYQYH